MNDEIFKFRINILKDYSDSLCDWTKKNHKDLSIANKLALGFEVAHFEKRIDKLKKKHQKHLRSLENEI